jgi:gamma-butyrobetaine dioxygenase
LDDPVPAGAIERIEALFATEALASYLGESLPTTQHLLQAAMRAEMLGAAPDLVVAALVHDVGQFVGPGRGTGATASDVVTAGDGSSAPDRPSEHAADGATWLARWFPPSVTEPVRLHVEAKRYLCNAEPDYLSCLSGASVRSLALQGGPMTTVEAAAFWALPYASDAVFLRRCDDWAKIPELEPPPLDHYRGMLGSLLGASSG